MNPLAHFRASLPYVAICGSRKSDHHILPRQDAATMPYVQINRKVPNRYGKGKVARISHVVLDLDYDLDGVDWEERGAPGPDLLSQNPEKRGGHYFLQLAKPVFVPDGVRVRKWHEGISRKPFELYLALEHYLKHALKADKSLRCQKVKNVLHPSHEVTEGGRGYPRSLTELCEWIDWNWIDEEIERGCIRPPNGQHDQLYMDALYFACDHAREFDDVYQLIDFCHLHEAEIHAFEFMPAADVKSTFKSACGVAWSRRDTWKVYPGRGQIRRAPLEPEEIRRRQQEAARTTALKRRERTLARLLEVARGIRLTKTALVRASGMTWKTVAKYWQQIIEVAGWNQKDTNSWSGIEKENSVSPQKRSAGRITGPVVAAEKRSIPILPTHSSLNKKLTIMPTAGFFPTIQSFQSTDVELGVSYTGLLPPSGVWRAGPGAGAPVLSGWAPGVGMGCCSGLSPPAPCS